LPRVAEYVGTMTGDIDDGLRWEPGEDGSATAYDGSHLVGYVQNGPRCTVRSVDGTVNGSRTSTEAARAELESWHRWNTTG
jgi:hypothetical protein